MHLRARVSEVIHLAIFAGMGDLLDPPNLALQGRVRALAQASCESPTRLNLCRLCAFVNFLLVQHIYNNRNSLSPFAGLAFDPVDGLCQASPYLVGLLLLPVHFWTHEGLLFFTAVWTTNIHDTLTGDTEPVMGSAYHTIHHTTYLNNYGQIFVFFDYIHDTLAPPIHKREQWGWKTPTGRDYGVDYVALAKKST
jgi:hypothetical protein